MYEANSDYTKYGDIGEKIVKELLNKEGWTIYQPETTGGHPFDKLICKKRDKYIIYTLEVKTKPRMLKYKITGIDNWQYNKSTKLLNDNNIDTYFIFVDELEEYIYGNRFSELIKKYEDGKGTIYPFKHPKFQNITYFHLDNMKKYHKLTKEELIELKSIGSKSKSIQTPKQENF